MLARALTVAFLGILSADLAQAQARDAWPSRPVRMIIPAAPGGNPDVLARMLGQKLSEVFGRPFVVENMPGAGGLVAAEAVVKMPADGHALFLGDSGALAINVALNPKIGYQPLRDFTLITALASLPTVLVVNPPLPVASLPDFVALAKAKPGQLAFGSAGNGSIHHLTMAIFASRAGIELLHVPYKGGTPMVAAVISGEVQAGWSGIPNVLQSIRAGRLRALCISTAKRSASLPEVPTAAELGFPGFDVATTLGLQAPAGVPPEIVARLQAAVAKALREPDTAARMANLGMELTEDGTESYVRYVKEDLERYTSAVKLLGLKTE
jgi:tripartite-type tricarboxylate transporter receptor subunit TctC